MQVDNLVTLQKHILSFPLPSHHVNHRLVVFYVDFHFWCDIGKVRAEGQFTGRTVPGLEAQINSTSLVKDIHGAPLESFVVKLSETISCLNILQKMHHLVKGCF